MASTNKTQYYNLPQYVASDKPTYLTDFNQAMATIDSALHSGNEAGNTANNSIGTLSNLETTVKTDLVSAINEVKDVTDTNTSDIQNNASGIQENSTAIGSLIDLATTTKANLVGSINELKGSIDDTRNLIPEVKDEFSQSSSNPYSCNYVNGKLTELTPVVLYKNSNGATGNIELSESVANFRYLEVIGGKGGYGDSSSKIDLSTTSNVCINGLYNATPQISQMYGATYSFEGTTGTRTGAWRINFNTNGTISFSQGTTDCSIYEVIGYK